MPFVLGPDLDVAVRQAAELGFEAFELFPPSIESIDGSKIDRLCQTHSIKLSTIGTGGGAVTQGLTLIDQAPQIRERANDYVRDLIECAGDLGASAIIGSMQGRIGERPREEVLSRLGGTIAELAEYAQKWDRPLFLEPLNRYESDVFNTVEAVAQFANEFNISNLLVLADLFHMNIEEAAIERAIRNHPAVIGHVHFVDSNRWVAGHGHSDLQSVAKALIEIGYNGYLAVEAFPLPDQLSAARSAIDAFRQLGLVQVKS